ncbi:MAG: sugar transferase [Sphingomicrobium sp.]
MQLIGGLLLTAFLPFLVRAAFQTETLYLPSSTNALVGNAVAVLLVFWGRLTIETYPGVRSSYLILPMALAAHAFIITVFLITRFPYDRVALGAGFVAHVVWNYAIYFLVQRRQHLRIAVVPFGSVDKLLPIEIVDWKELAIPDHAAVRNCNAIVADFSADLPDAWEAFLADAALNGRIVYQVNQLFESLTGRVQIAHLSENSFGSLVPMRAYSAIKHAGDFAFAILVLPIVLPVMALVAIAILLLEGRPVFYRQMRVGASGKLFRVFKFRTMRAGAGEPSSLDGAMTKDGDARITRIGSFLRGNRLDEVPQIFNILRGEMSWIGPRPEAAILSDLYTSEIPFYRYRHVVRPGISGWAQVNQGHVADVDDVHLKLQYDFFYVKYFSPWLDLLIVFRTIKTILTGFGSK